MTKHYSIIGLLLGALILSGCVSKSRVITVKGANDQLEDKIEISTYSYERPAFGTIPVGTADAFFRAYINKDSKRPLIQLYIMTSSNNWSYWNKIKFNQDNNLKTMDIIKVGSDAQCSAYGCTHFEDGVVRLTLDQLKYFASQKKATIVRISSSKVSSSIDINISPEEAQAFLGHLDKHTS